MTNLKTASDVSARGNVSPGLCWLSMMLLLFVASTAWAQPSSVVFNGFDNPDSVYRIEHLGKSPRPDLAGTDGVAQWEEWCFDITSLDDTNIESG